MCCGRYTSILRVHPSRRESACTNTHRERSWTNTYVHPCAVYKEGAHMRSREPVFPLKIYEAIGSSSCSIILLLPLFSSVASCAFPTLKDVTSCNADQRGRERASRAATSAGSRGNLLDCNSIKA